MMIRTSILLLEILIVIVTVTVTTAQTTVCHDLANWIDQYGDGCEWYDRDGACENFGDCCANYGHTASSACCACGGGEDVVIDYPTPAPKDENDDMCTDLFGWRDAYGDDCGWYETQDPTCSEYGWSMPGTNGTYPMEACCTCGGGSYFVEPPSGMPSVVLSEMPSIAVSEMPSIAVSETPTQGLSGKCGCYLW